MNIKKTDDMVSYRKVYYANNKDKIRDYNKMWSDNHPDYYKNYARGKRATGWTCPKVACEICGFITHKNNLIRHQASKKCIAISQGFKGYSKYNPKHQQTEEQKEEQEEQADAPVLL